VTPVDLILINPNNKRRAYGTLAAGIAGIEPPLWTGLLAAYGLGCGFNAGRDERS
jgi:hypothetical protein